MNIDFQKLGEILNECVNEEMFIRVGRYEGDYHLGGSIQKDKRRAILSKQTPIQSLELLAMIQVFSMILILLEVMLLSHQPTKNLKLNYHHL